MEDFKPSDTGESQVAWPYAATLILRAATPEQRRWAVEGAINLVRSLAEKQSKVVLADLHIERSDLLEATGIVPGPGIVDVLFRGTSFSVVARRPEGESFFFLTVGTNPPPLQVIYSHPQWKKIAERLPDTGAHLLPCVSAEQWEEFGPIPGFEACVVLNGDGAEVTLPAGAHSIAEYVAPPEVRAPETFSTDFPDFDEPALADAEAAATPEVEIARDETIEMVSPEDEVMPTQEEGLEEGAVEEGDGAAAEEAQQRTLADHIAQWRESAEAESGASEGWPIGIGRDVGGGREMPEEAPGWQPPVEPLDSYSSVKPSRRHIRPAWLAGAVGVTAVLAFVLWKVISPGQIPADSDALEAAVDPVEEAAAAQPAEDQSQPRTEVADADAAAAQATDSDAPDDEPADARAEIPADTSNVETLAAQPEELPEEISLSYSVVIASFSSFDDALTRQREWATTGTAFYVAPTVVRGVVYYRVYAAWLPDRESAGELMQRLVDEGTKESAGAWDIRPTQLAFHFGVYRSQRDAEMAVETLVAKGIPAYTVPAPAVAGSEAYHVYAGGYESSAQARPLAEQIQNAGINAELVERVGLVTP